MWGRRAWFGLAAGAVSTAMVAGCLVTSGPDEDCGDLRFETYFLIEPPPAVYEPLVRACETDSNQCLALCSKLLHETEPFEDAEVCVVVHSWSGHHILTGYESTEDGAGCAATLSRVSGADVPEA